MEEEDRGRDEIKESKPEEMEEEEIEEVDDAPKDESFMTFGKSFFTDSRLSAEEKKLIGNKRKRAIKKEKKLKSIYLSRDFNPIHIKATITSIRPCELKPKILVFPSANIAINPEKKIISIMKNSIFIKSFKISFKFLIIYPPNKKREIIVVIKVGLILIFFE